MAMKLKSLSTSTPVVTTLVSTSIVCEPSIALLLYATTRTLTFAADGETVGETPVRLGVARRALGVLVAPHATALFGPSGAGG